MNKYIEVVKRWLDNPELVSLEELRAKREDADLAMLLAADAAAYDSACYVADAAAYYAVANAEAAVATNTDTARDTAADWVKRYEELTK
jgi:hypothetical protein